MTKKEIHDLEMKNPTFQIKEGLNENGKKEYFIVANSGGLYQFAEQLMEIADELAQNVGIDKGYLETNDWVSGDIIIDHVNIVRHDSTKKFLENKKSSLFKNALGTMGCCVLVLIIVVSFIIGLVTIYGWIF